MNARAVRLGGTRRRTLWVNLGLVVVVVALVVVALVIMRAPASAKSSVRTARVASGTVTATVSGTGNVASAAAVELDFATSGTVASIAVSPGQTVTAGQTLAVLDQSADQRAVSTATAQLASAQAALTAARQGATPAQLTKDQLAVQSAQLSLAGAQTQVGNATAQQSQDAAQSAAAVAAAQAALAAGTGTQAQVDSALNQQASTALKDSQAVTSAEQSVRTAQLQVTSQQATLSADRNPTSTAIAQAQAQVTSAQAALDAANQTLAQTTLTAPQAGTVLSVNGIVGQQVSAGGRSAVSSSSSSSSSGSGLGSGSSSSSSSSSSFVEIADLGQLQVTANIAEADAASVKVGQTATVTFPATGETASGTVTALSPTSITSSNVVEYPVTVALSGTPADIHLGATAAVTITTASVDNALYVPSSAITTVSTGHTVTVLAADGTQQTVTVEVGLAGDTGTQITSGLTEGQQVVLPTATTTTGTFPALGGLGGGRG